VNTQIVVNSPVYVPWRGVGVAVSWRSGRDEDGRANPYWNVLFGKTNEEGHHETTVYRAIPTFAGWLFIDHDGRPFSVPYTPETRRGTWAGPPLQNIPSRRKRFPL
jgi:hypothetical protein